MLNDINGFHVAPEHVADAIAAASDGPVPEGGVGGGTGMICHDFMGGIGTASRVLRQDPAPPPAGSGSIIIIVGTDAPLCRCSAIA
jgi:D-aminopeptidase